MLTVTSPGMVGAEGLEPPYSPPEGDVLAAERSTSDWQPAHSTGIGTSGWTRTSRKRFWKPHHVPRMTDV